MSELEELEECEFVRIDTESWLCTVHQRTEIRKHEPVFCSFWWATVQGPPKFKEEKGDA